jgi:hypothetical protein
MTEPSQRVYEAVNPLQVRIYRTWDGARNVIGILEAMGKVDFCVAGRDPVLSWAFDHRQVRQLDEVRQASCMPPESVILIKLRAYQDSGSTRHLDDIQSILRISGPELDLAYIHPEAAKMEYYPTWQDLSRNLGRE